MSELTNNNYIHLRLLSQGVTLDMCIEPSNKIGKIFPSRPDGLMVNVMAIANLKAKGLVRDEIIKCFGLEYKRYSISDFGKETFEEYKSACSK